MCVEEWFIIEKPTTYIIYEENVPSKCINTYELLPQTSLGWNDVSLEKTQPLAGCLKGTVFLYAKIIIKAQLFAESIKELYDRIPQ